MNYTHFVGLELGQQRDYTACTILEELASVGERAACHVNVPEPRWHFPAGLTDWQVEQALAWAPTTGDPAPPSSLRVTSSACRSAPPHPRGRVREGARLDALVRTRQEVAVAVSPDAPGQ